MHISTTALSVVLLSFLGGSQTAHAMEYDDAYGVTKYGFQCEGRVYTKPVIFAAAKNLCDKLPRQSHLQYPSFSMDGYRGPYGYNTMINMRASELLKLYYTFTPIFADGRLFAFDPPRHPADRKDWIEPGPDRLVVDNHCNIMGAFTDKDYTRDIYAAKVKACTVLNSKEDIRTFDQSSGKSPQRSREHSLDGFSQRSREHSPDGFSQRSREHSPDGISQRFREQSPGGFSQRSREQTPDISSQRSREQTPERPLERFSQRSRQQTPE